MVPQDKMCLYVDDTIVHTVWLHVYVVQTQTLCYNKAVIVLVIINKKRKKSEADVAKNVQN